MNYHNIVHDDIRNGSGLRVTLFVAGCSHHCNECQNPQTWDIESGIPFDEAAKNEIFEELSKNYIAGITLSGGDPLHDDNVEEIYHFLKQVREKFPLKTIWIYTGYTYEHIVHWEFEWEQPESKSEAYRASIVNNYCDVLVDGRFDKNKSDVNYHWAGSTNQRVIDIPKTIENGRVTLWALNGNK